MVREYSKDEQLLASSLLPDHPETEVKQHRGCFSAKVHKQSQDFIKEEDSVVLTPLWLKPYTGEEV